MAHTVNPAHRPAYLPGERVKVKDDVSVYGGQIVTIDASVQIGAFWALTEAGKRLYFDRHELGEVVKGARS